MSNTKLKKPTCLLRMLKLVFIHVNFYIRLSVRCKWTIDTLELRYFSTFKGNMILQTTLIFIMPGTLLTNESFLLLVWVCWNYVICNVMIREIYGT